MCVRSLTEFENWQLRERNALLDRLVSELGKRDQVISYQEQLLKGPSLLLLPALLLFVSLLLCARGHVLMKEESLALAENHIHLDGTQAELITSLESISSLSPLDEFGLPVVGSVTYGWRENGNSPILSPSKHKHTHGGPQKLRTDKRADVQVVLPEIHSGRSESISEPRATEVSFLSYSYGHVHCIGDFFLTPLLLFLFLGSVCGLSVSVSV